MDTVAGAIAVTTDVAAPRAPRAVRIAFDVLLLAIGVYFLFGLIAGAQPWAPAISAWSYIALEAAAAALATLRVILLPIERLPWALMSGALWAVTIGDTIDLVAANGGVLENTSGAVVFYVLFLVLAFASVVTLMRRRLPRATASVWLDGLMAVFGLVAISTAVVFPSAEIIEASDLLALGYVLAPLALTALLVGAGIALGRSPSRVWWILTAGFMAMTVSSALQYSAVIENRLVLGGLGDGLWPLGMTFVALGVWRAGIPPRALGTRSLATVAAPITFIMVALALIVLDEFIPQPGMTQFFAVATIAAGAIRLLLTAIDAERLRREQSALAESLAIARDSAVQAAQARSSFLATMSHEIRTPMNAIIGMTDLVLGSPLTEGQREQVEIVRRSSELLLDLINNVLDFSKLESGDLELESEPFNLVTAVEDPVELMAMAAEEKGLKLICEFADDTPDQVIGDVTRLRQVIVNLVGNAVKFTPSGQVVVSVRRAKGNLLRFEVSDSGIGIPKNRMERMFRAFSQVDASTTRLYGGTGLGLAISQAIVTRMGGTIRVASTQGVGSRFWFEAPFEPVEQAEQPVATRRAAGRRREITGQLARWNSATDDAAAESIVPVWPQGTPVPSMTVLVAEDNPVNQRTAQLLLERAGHAVTLVGNGLEAVEAVKRQHFGAVLMDIDMPVMDGLTASRAIRELGTTIEQPRIVAVTASASPADKRRCEAAGMDLYMTKPIRSDDLIASLCAIASRDLVDRQDGGASGAGIDELPPELVAELHAQFVSDSEKTLAELEAAFAVADHREVGRLAHRLRGSSSALRANELASACATVEGAARSDGGIPAAAFERLRSETEYAIAHFRA